MVTSMYHSFLLQVGPWDAVEALTGLSCIAATMDPQQLYQASLLLECWVIIGAV